MSERKSPRYESEECSSELQVVCHSQLRHDYPADLGLHVTVFVSEHDFISWRRRVSVMASMDAILEQGEECVQVTLLATLV